MYMNKYLHITSYINKYVYKNKIKISHIKPMPVTQSLHNRQGQFSGIQSFILFLKISTFSADLYLLGNKLFQTIGPKFLNDHSPLYTVFIFGLKKVLSDLRFKTSFLN